MNTGISRVVVRSKDVYEVLQTEHIIYLKIDKRTVTILDRDNNSWPLKLCGLSDVEKLLDQRIFFRANRNFIININYVKKFRILSRSKVKVDLCTLPQQEIILSQKNSTDFKNWVSEGC